MLYIRLSTFQLVNARRGINEEKETEGENVASKETDELQIFDAIQQDLESQPGFGVDIFLKQ